MSKVDPAVCEISRWQKRRGELDNLELDAFVNKFRSTPGAILLDVRTKEEADNLKLRDASVLDYLAEGFLEKLEDLDPEQTYFVYCRSGRRSVRVCTLMLNSGFTHLFHLDGGLQAWRQEVSLYV